MRIPGEAEFHDRVLRVKQEFLCLVIAILIGCQGVFRDFFTAGYWGARHEESAGVHFPDDRLGDLKGQKKFASFNFVARAGPTVRIEYVRVLVDGVAEVGTCFYFSRRAVVKAIYERVVREKFPRADLHHPDRQGARRLEPAHAKVRDLADEGDG